MRERIEFVISTCRAGVVRLSRKGSYCNLPQASMEAAEIAAQREARNHPFAIERIKLKL
mgnify:CR=1 FL=1